MENQDNSEKQNAKFLGNIKENVWRFEWVNSAMKYWIFDEKDKLVCSTVGIIEAKRIVSCVNACAGLQAEYLETANIANELYPTPAFFIGTENGIEDIETPPSDN